MLRGVLSAILGICALFWPSRSLAILITLAGVFILADGATGLAGALRNWMGSETLLQPVASLGALACNGRSGDLLGHPHRRVSYRRFVVLPGATNETAQQSLTGSTWETCSWSILEALPPGVSMAKQSAAFMTAAVGRKPLHDRRGSPSGRVSRVKAGPHGFTQLYRR